MQLDLSAIEKWSQENHLPLCRKSECLHYGHKNPKYSYVVNGDTIKSMLECADLGIMRSANFDYRQLIDKICLQALRLSAMLSRVYVSHDKTAQTRLFNTYVRPIVIYAAPIWNPTEQGLTAQLERILRSFTRRFFVQRALNYEAVKRAWNCVLSGKKRLYLDLIMACKLLYGLVDIDVNKINIMINSNNTRGGGTNIVVNRARTAYEGKSFTYRIATCWNHVPLSVKTSASLTVFKSRLRCLLS